MKIKTERLILREWEQKDKKDIIEGINNLRVSKWLLSVPFPYKKKDVNWWIKHCQEKLKKKKRESYELAIELKKEKKVIGGFALAHFDKTQGTATLGYWLNEKYHNKGYGTEALGKLIEFAFEKLKLRRLNACVFVRNPSSGRLLEKFGAKKEGLKRKSQVCKADGKIKDDIVYGLLKSEWKRK